jgi:hypothetical protein
MENTITLILSDKESANVVACLLYCKQTQLAEKISEVSLLQMQG